MCVQHGYPTYTLKQTDSYTVVCLRVILPTLANEHMFFFADICIIRAEYSKVNQKMNKCSLLLGSFSYITMLNEILTSAFTTINRKFLLHSEKIRMVIQSCGKVGP